MSWSISPHFSFSSRSLQLGRSSRPNPSGTQNSRKMRADLISFTLVPQPQAWIWKGRGSYCQPSNIILYRSLCTYFVLASPMHSWRQLSLIAFPKASSEASDPTDGESVRTMDKDDASELDSDPVDYLVQILHKSAKSFSIAIQCFEVARNGSQLAKAWIGVDVHAWHKHIAYQAAIYALLQTAIELGVMALPYDKYRKDQAPLHKIISPKIFMLQEYIESQLNRRDPKLVKWFQKEQLSVLSVFFIPLLERLAAEYAKSGVAAIVLAISCCIAVRKLGAARISCPMFALFVPDMIGEVMDLLHSTVSIENFHNLASEAGFESEFLAHFGPKVLHRDTRQDVVFWMGLIQKKICVAFCRESVSANLQIFCNTEVLGRDFTTLGIFALLGRKTRLFLTSMGIKDIDEQLKDFLSYLECGGLFIYPELSSISMYQHFMEVITEEIGWLDFYAAVPCIRPQERRRSKQHAIQAEKEIILSTVFNVCLNMFSSFAHFSKSTQQPLDSNLVAFLLRSQNLLNICLEDYLDAYDKSCEVLKITEVCVPDLKASLGNQSAMSAYLPFEVHLKPADIMMRRIAEYRHQRVSQMSKFSSTDMMDAVILERQPDSAKRKPVCQSLLRKCTNKLISTSSDIWMGTRLLFIDMSVALGLFHKKICGHILTKRERKKLMRTIADVASVIPVAILMLLPVSAVGHAAIFAAIKKYIPSLIPSPYSSERLDVAKQLNRTKKMEVQSWSNLDVCWSNLDVSSSIGSS